MEEKIRQTIERKKSESNIKIALESEASKLNLNSLQNNQPQTNIEELKEGEQQQEEKRVSELLKQQQEDEKSKQEQLKRQEEERIQLEVLKKQKEVQALEKFERV